MFCRYCGNQTDNPDGVCQDCRNAHAGANGNAGQGAPASPAYPGYPSAPYGGGYNDVKTAQVQGPYDKKYGFGGALAATIVGVIGFFFAYFALIFGAAAVAEASLVWVAVAFLVVGVACSVIGLVFGIKGIRCFNEARLCGVKPVATLVLGIVGTVASGFGLFFELLALIFCLAI